MVGDIEATLWILLGAVGFLLLIALALPPRDTLDSRLSFHRQVVDRLRALPGAVDVAAASTLPLDGVLNSGSHSIEGRPLAEGDVSPMFAARVVSPGYFAAMRIALGAQAGDVRRPRCSRRRAVWRWSGVTLGVGAALALTPAASGDPVRDEPGRPGRLWWGVAVSGVGVPAGELDAGAAGWSCGACDGVAGGVAG